MNQKGTAQKPYPGIGETISLGNSESHNIKKAWQKGNDDDWKKRYDAKKNSKETSLNPPHHPHLMNPNCSACHRRSEGK